MDSKEFLISEHNMLRSEIRERINDIELLQRNALIFSGAIWAWLATRGWNPTYIFVVCLPFVITSLFWLKSKITSKDIRKFATYNKQPRPEDVVLIKPPKRGRKLAPRGGKLELSPGFF